MIAKTRPRPCLKIHPKPRPDVCSFCYRFLYSQKHRTQWQGEGPALPAPTLPTPIVPSTRPWIHANVGYCARDDSWKWSVHAGGRHIASGVRPYEDEAREAVAYVIRNDPAVRTVRVRFAHGLGDATNFVHSLPLYTRCGYTIEVECRPDEAPVFRAGGATVIDTPGVHHPWGHAPMDDLPAWPAPWTRNKNAWNIIGPDHPMPPLDDDPAELWKEYTEVKLDFSPQVTDYDRNTADDLLAGASRPWVILHHRGFQWGSYRDYPDDMTTELVRKLVARIGGTVIILDRDERGVRLSDPEVRYLRYYQPGQMYEVVRRCDILIGIDSGPLNFVRFTDVPAIGVWRVHYPSDYFLPRRQTVHIVQDRHAIRDKYEREHWNTILAPDDGPSPEFVANVACQMLSGPKYLSGRENVARDVQLQNYVSRTDSDFRSDFDYRVNRHESFDRVLRFLKTRHKPVVVETGCIRSEEDWAGAGFSTYLFGAFLARHGGEMHSVDLTPKYAEFARTWTQEFNCVTVHESHSFKFLESWTGPPIDLFFADSCDTSEPEHQDCCLGEVQRVLPKLAPGARILIDDTPPDGKGGWKGKGGKAVPYLLSIGWEIEFSGWQILLRSKIGA